MQHIDDTINVCTTNIAWWQDTLKRLQELKARLGAQNWTETLTVLPPVRVPEQNEPLTLGPRLKQTGGTPVKPARAIVPRGTKRATSRGAAEPQRKRAASVSTVEMLAVVRRLTEPFSPTDLMDAAGMGKSAACSVLTRFKDKGWLNNPGHGKWERTKLFPRDNTPEKVTDLRGRRDTFETVVEIANPQPAKPKLAAPPDESKITPFSIKAIELGRKLKQVFTIEELATLLPGEKQAAYYWTKQWRDRDWITKEDYDTWRKAATFGE